MDKSRVYFQNLRKAFSKPMSRIDKAGKLYYTDDLGPMSNARRFIVWTGDKIPVNPLNTNDAISAFDANYWLTLDEAERLYLNDSNVRGVGLVNMPGLVFVDVDANKERSEEFRELVLSLPETFTEISVSGKGLHRLYYSLLQQNLNDFKSVGLEIYATIKENMAGNKWIALTGNWNTAIEIAEVSSDIFQQFKKVTEVSRSIAPSSPIDEKQSSNNQHVDSGYDEVTYQDQLFADGKVNYNALMKFAIENDNRPEELQRRLGIFWDGKTWTIKEPDYTLDNDQSRTDRLVISSMVFHAFKVGFRYHLHDAVSAWFKKTKLFTGVDPKRPGNIRAAKLNSPWKAKESDFPGETTLDYHIWKSIQFGRNKRQGR